jgi:hypothetical protein
MIGGLKAGSKRGAAVAIMLLHFEVDDYDTWKPMFDTDPVGRKDAGATSHIVSRAVDNPNEVFIRVAFPSTDQAQAFRDKLVASGTLERAGMRVKSGPTVVEVADSTTY